MHLNFNNENTLNKPNWKKTVLRWILNDHFCSGIETPSFKLVELNIDICDPNIFGEGVMT